MNIKENEILHEALRRLEDYLGVKNAVTVNGEDFVTILGTRFFCEVKPTLNKTTYNLAATYLKDIVKSSNIFPLLVCGSVSEEVLSTAKSDGINVLDVAGNCEITPIGGPYLSVRGRKSEFRKQPATMVFRTAGLKVLYYLLLDLNNIRKPYRFIQADTGVSVATVKNVVDALTPQYCFESKEGRNLKDVRSLLDFWVQQYNILYKPRLRVTNLDFTSGGRMTWKNIPLPYGMSWGGECGSNMIDGYLYPETFELYSEIPVKELLKTGAAIPTPTGEITVYEKFWKMPKTGIHPLVIYADLMGIADSRCREEAQRILDHELSYIK